MPNLYTARINARTSNSDPEFRMALMDIQQETIPDGFLQALYGTVGAKIYLNWFVSNWANSNEMQ